MCVHLHKLRRIKLALMSATMPVAVSQFGFRHVHLGARPYAVRVIPVQLAAAGDWKQVAADLAVSTARVGESTVVFATGETETKEIEDLIMQTTASHGAIMHAARPTHDCATPQRRESFCSIKCVRFGGGAPASVEAQLHAPLACDSARIVIGTDALARGVTLDATSIVIDPRLGKRPRSVFGMEKYVTMLLGDADAAHRAGRTGRTQPGTVFRFEYEPDSWGSE